MVAVPQKVRTSLFAALCVGIVVVDSVSWFLSMAGDLVLVGGLYLASKLPVSD